VYPLSMPGARVGFTSVRVDISDDKSGVKGIVGIGGLGDSGPGVNGLGD
jgi:hypothetical protein